MTWAIIDGVAGVTAGCLAAGLIAGIRELGRRGIRHIDLDRSDRTSDMETAGQVLIGSTAGEDSAQGYPVGAAPAGPRSR